MDQDGGQDRFEDQDGGQESFVDQKGGPDSFVDQMVEIASRMRLLMVMMKSYW